MKWYSKFDKIERKGSLNCPNCKHSLFIIDFAGFHKYIYTIDLFTAPHLIRNIFDNLKTKEYIEAYNELKELYLMICNFDE
jgi:hypothetical protein